MHMEGNTVLEGSDGKGGWTESKADCTKRTMDQAHAVSTG